MYTPELLKALGRTQRLQNAFYRRLEYATGLIALGLVVLVARRWLNTDQIEVLPVAGLFFLAAGVVALSSWKLSVEYMVARREAKALIKQNGYPAGLGTRPGI